jgi:hypothetical protein
MNRLQVTKGIIGLCVVMAANCAWADSNPFVARWHWNGTQSTRPAGDPAPNDLTLDISRADGTHMKWSLTVAASPGQSSVETFDAPANGEFYPISSDTTAAFRLTGSTLQATFKGPTGETDALTCVLGTDQKTMTCKGVLSDGAGPTTNYVDVFDRM